MSVDHPISKYEKDKYFQEFKENVKNWYNRGSIAQASKIGFKTNLLAINPLDNKNKVPVILQFCLMDYGLEQVLAVLLMTKEITILLKNINLKLKL